VKWMQKHRAGRRSGEMRLMDLTRGPGRLAAALQIDRRHDGVDLCGVDSSLWLGELVADESTQDSATGQSRVVSKTVRIGITQAADKLLRFYERGNRFVSGPKRLLAPTKKKNALAKRKKTNSRESK
jgi:DNA-3-methyladenine glycosylase